MPSCGTAVEVAGVTQVSGNEAHCACTDQAQQTRRAAKVANDLRSTARRRRVTFSLACHALCGRAQASRGAREPGVGSAHRDDLLPGRTAQAVRLTAGVLDAEPTQLPPSTAAAQAELAVVVHGQADLRRHPAPARCDDARRPTTAVELADPAVVQRDAERGARAARSARVGRAAQAGRMGDAGGHGTHRVAQGPRRAVPLAHRAIGPPARSAAARPGRRSARCERLRARIAAVGHD